MNVQDFRIDLTDLTACGVYYVTREDIDTLARSASQYDFNVHRVDLAGCRDHATLAARLAEGLSLPKNYGRDWSTLVDYLQDMDGLPSRGHIVLFTHADEWQEADPDTLDTALDTLEETAAIWSAEGVAFFVFLPQAMPTPVMATMPG